MFVIDSIRSWLLTGCIHLINGGIAQVSVVAALSTTNNSVGDVAYEIFVFNVSANTVVTAYTMSVITNATSTKATYYLTMYAHISGPVGNGRSVVSSTTNFCKIIATRNCLKECFILALEYV